MGDGFFGLAVGTTVEDLVPGKPAEIGELASRLSRYASAFESSAQRLRSLDTSGWEGEAAQAFRERVEGLPKKLDTACEAFSSAASAVRVYREVVISAQRVAREVLTVDAVEARAKSRRHAAAVADYNAAVNQGVRGSLPPEVDPGQTAMVAAWGRARKVREEVESAGWEAVRKIHEAAEKAPSKPGGGLRSFLSGVKEGALELADATVRYSPVRVLANPEGWVRDVATDLDGVRWGASHPVQFAKAAVDWEMWQKDPNRALGRLLPGSLLALVTGGAGLGRRGVTALQKGTRGGARRRATEDPPKAAQGERSTPTTADPIDLTSGRVLMPQADLALPGDLPLVVERVHDSSYRVGRWFGPSWASTFDQRLELDGEGVVLVGADGVVLSYPVPVAGEAVLPAHGPRWPLSWDGVPGSPVRVEVPERGWTWTFAALAGDDFDPGDLPVRSLTDRNGQRIDFHYGPDGEPWEVRHSGGYRVAVDTDPGTATRIIGLRVLDSGEEPDDGGGTQVLSYGYDEAGNLAEVVNSSDQPLRFTYDDASRMTSWTDRNGTSYQYVYDSAGRCVRAEGTGGFLSCHLTYDEANRATRFTNSLGHTTVYRYNHAYRLTSETDPLGHTTYREWDETGRLLTAVTDPLGHTTRYTYDAEENLTAIIRPDGSQATASYGALRLPETVTEPDGALWRHTYDARGNRTSTVDPAGAVTRYAHDQGGRLTQVTDPLGHTTRVAPNAAGLPLSVTDPLGHTTTISRDAFGRPVTVTDPLGHTTTMTWTVEGKPARRQHPGGAVEAWEWDAEGNLLSHTNPAGHTTSRTHTHFDLPASRTDADGLTHRFAYDTERRLVAVTNPRGEIWSYTYDPAGHLISETDFNGHTLTYTHDAAGQLTSRTNGAGQRLDYTHDPLGRRIRQQASTGEETTYAYDLAGRLLSAANPDAQVTLVRDPLGQVLAETVDGHTTHYAYDPAGRLTQRTTPTGLTSRWAHDPAGQPVRLSTADHLLEFAYDPAGRETSRQLGDQLTLTQDWDESAGRLRAQSLTGPDDLLLQHREYTYRADSHVTAVRDLSQGLRSLALTPGGRPTAVNAIGWRETYAYDAVGNTTHAEAPHHPSPGPREHSGTLVRRAGRTTYAHDDAGRRIRTTRTLLNGQKRTWTYTYDAEDRLVRATNPAGETWHYTYDPLGRRTAKHRVAEDGTATDHTHFTWDGTRLAEQTAPDGTLTSWDYEPGTHRPLTHVTRTPVAESPSDDEPTSRILELAAPTQADYDTAFHAIVTDLVGTPTELVTPTGHLAWQHRSTLWGTPLHDSGSVDCPLRFPGQYHDPETGLHYNHHRYYDPETGAYTGPDPLGLAASPHPHGYVANPYAWIDPLGLTPCSSANPDDLLANQGAKIGTQGGARKMPSRDVRSEQELDEYWNIISSGAKEVDMPNYPGVVMERPDGTRIMRRDVSSDGSPTIDVKPGDGSMQWKIHIKRQ